MALSGNQKAYTWARSNIARSGATRANYYNFTVGVRVYRQTGWVDLTPYVIQGSLTIVQGLNDSIDRANFTLQPSTAANALNLQAGEQVSIGFGDAGNVAFAGQMITIAERYQAGLAAPWTDVLCVDWMDLFDAKLVTTEYPVQSGTTILKDLVARFLPPNTFTTNGIQPDMPTIETVPVTNQRLSTVFRRVTTHVGGGFYIDPNRDIRAWAAGSEPDLPQPMTLSKGLASLKQFTVTMDAAQIRTRMLIEGKRTTTPLGIPAGSGQMISVPVDDSSFFELEPGGSTPVRIGTQRAIWQGKDALNPNENPPGSTVTVDALPGDTVLNVANPTILMNPVTNHGWVEVGNQLVRFHGINVGTRLEGIPSSGYGAILGPLKVGDAVTARPYLYDVDTFDLSDPLPATFHSQSPEQPVVMVYRQTDEDARNAWFATMAGLGDGIRETLVQDGRLSHDGAAARADAELRTFSGPLSTASWETDDLNANVGRLQATAGLTRTDQTYLITDVTITFPVPGQLPRRQCSGTTLRTATLLDVLLVEQS